MIEKKKQSKNDEVRDRKCKAPDQIFPAFVRRRSLAPCPFRRENGACETESHKTEEWEDQFHDWCSFGMGRARY